jgi:hypothetical protein
MPGTGQSSAIEVNTRRLCLTGEVGDQRCQGWISVEVLEKRIVEVTDDVSRIVSEAVWTGIWIDVNAVPYRLVVVRSLKRQDEASVSVSERLRSFGRTYKMHRPVHERPLVNVAAAGTRRSVYRRRIWHRDWERLESTVAVRDIFTVA